MEFKEIVALLLFVLPGIIAEKISYRMDFPAAEKRSYFREIVNGMLLSLPVVLIAVTVAACINEFKTISSFINAFNNLLFLVTFSILVVAIAIVVGIVKGLAGDFMYWVINKIRFRCKKMEIDNKSCWRQAFLEENVPRYVKIFKDESLLREGFVEYYSLPNEEMSIVLEEPEHIDYYLKRHPKFKDYLKLCRTYVNIEKGVIVEIYDTTEVNKYLESLSKDSG